jgi:hypothetical protein
LPAGGGAAIGYKLSKTYRGIMMTEGPATFSQLKPKACEAAKEWFMDNAGTILEQRSVTQEKGIWVVTGTWAANC